jgi:hypothetical protein
LRNAEDSGGVGNRPPAKEALLKFSPSSPATGTLLFVGLAALFSTTPGVAQVARPLTAEQVACDADQLRSMLARSALFFGPAYDERTAMFLFTYGAPSRDLSGLALLEQSDLQGQAVGPEHQMAFTITPSQPRLSRDPARAQLNTNYLLREPVGTDVGLIEEPSAMAVVVDPTLDPLRNEDSASVLVIDNIASSEGGVPSDSKAGRGLTGILQRCRNNFTAADIHVFEILSRVVRATVYTTPHPNPGAGRMHKLATIYRGEETAAIAGGVRATYRMDLYPVTKEKLRRVSLEIEIDLDRDGSPGNAVMRVLPACASADAPASSACSSSPSAAVVSIIRPPAADQLWKGPMPSVCWHGDAGCPTQVRFSFAERLQGTTWLHP